MTHERDGSDPRTGAAERAAELLCDRALEGLGAEGEQELAWLVANGYTHDDDRLETAAAAIALAYEEPTRDALPAHLRQRVLADAQAVFAGQHGGTVVMSGPVVPMAPRAPGAAASARGATVPLPAAALPGAIPAPIGPGPSGSVGSTSVAPPGNVAPFPHSRAEATPRPSRALTWIGWLAAAACLALAVTGWWPGRRQAAAIARTGIALPAVTAPPPSEAEQRAVLLASGGDVVRVEWSATKDAAAKGAKGDVVWSNGTQKGYMRFSGLAANDPAVSQYQLWIFDAEKDKRFPVDGGVFDVGPNGEVVVPIAAKIRVGKPVLFAVTVEKPGGVVVSRRERIVVIAKVPG